MAGAAPASSSRYDAILRLASGGMATVWVGTVRGALGFRQLVAIKKPHPHLLTDPSYRNEIVAEARLASMIHHANVVDVRDVEIDGESISLVMDYIEGASLGELLVACANLGQRLPPRVAVRIAVDALAGLHAAHELVDERGRPVGLVHRDVSPQNIIVGSDGIARVADFGVAKFARKNMASTSDGSLKGKLAYMAPEYLRGETIDRRLDVFALGVVLWEALSGERCFRRGNEAETLHALLAYDPAPISAVAPDVGTALDAIVTCALMKKRDARFGNAAAMAAALESTAGAAHLIAGHVEVAATVKTLAGAAIEERRALVRAKLANEPSVASMFDAPPMADDPRLHAPAAVLLPEDAEATTVTTTRAIDGPMRIAASTLPIGHGFGSAPPLVAERAIASAQRSFVPSDPPPGPPSGARSVAPGFAVESTDAAARAVLPRPRRWVVPLAIVLLAGGAAAYYGLPRRPAKAVAPPPPLTPSSSTTAVPSPTPSTSSSAESPPAGSSLAAPSGATVAPARVTTKPNLPHALPPPPPSTRKPPPPNPYEERERAP